MRIHQVENLKHMQNSAKVFLTPLHSAILVSQEHHTQALVFGFLSFRDTAGDHKGPPFPTPPPSPLRMLMSFLFD